MKYQTKAWRIAGAGPDSSAGRPSPALRCGLVALVAAASAAMSVSVRADDVSLFDADQDFGGIVYAMTNASDGNEILAFFRNTRGELRPVPRATASTGGYGASTNAPIDPLGSQNALVYDADHDLLFAVNAGDNTVAAIEPGAFGLKLSVRSLVPSGGYIPVSVAVSEDLLYVLNAGGTGSVSTFKIGEHGHLDALGTLDLGLPPRPAMPPFNRVLAPGQVGVDALARHLIVTHGGGQELLVAALDDDGVPQGPIVSNPSTGVVPFAFDVTPYGSLLVAEAGSGSVSAYDPTVGATLPQTATSVATGQAATCWIVVRDGGYAYVSNTVSSTLSLFGYTRTGQLALLDDVVASLVPGSAPIDMTLANGGGYLYTLDGGTGTISAFAIDDASGALEHVGTQGGLPASAGIQGIAARDF